MSTNAESEPLCPACEQAQTTLLITWSEPFRIHMCPSCGLVFARPLPSDAELQAFYQGFVYRKPAVAKIRPLIEARKAEFYRLGVAPASDSQAKRFLDYGGGVGIATIAAQEMGYDAHIYEVDQEAVDFAINELALPLSRVIQTVETGNTGYDVIFCDNVIEHVKEPAALIRLLKDSLNSGGTAYIKTPHARNTEAYFYPTVNILGYFVKARKYGNSFATCLRAHMKRYWHCDPPRHIYSFSRLSLLKFADQASAGHREIRYYRVPFWEYTIARREIGQLKSLGVVGYGRRKLENLLLRRGSRAALLTLILPLLVVVELVLKALQLVASACGIVSPGGIMLVIKKR